MGETIGEGSQPTAGAEMRKPCFRDKIESSSCPSHDEPLPSIQVHSFHDEFNEYLQASKTSSERRSGEK